MTSRTAGFNTIDLAVFVRCVHVTDDFAVFIGGAPGSTAGGIKTTTLGLLFFTAVSSLRGSKDINAFSRRMEPMAVRRAITIVLIALTVIASGIMLLSGTNPELSFIEVVFEVVSAFGTVGAVARRYAVAWRGF